MQTKLKHTSGQFLRFLAVGCINTGITLVVIAVCKSWLGINPYVSNCIGYVAGLINSFLWNRMWVFHSHGRAADEAFRFLIGWGLCYCIQLAFVWLCTTHTFMATLLWHIGDFAISGYGIATIMGMGVYTVCNFLYNRLVAFRSAAH